MTPRKLLTIRPPSSENVNAKPNITCRDATLADLPALREVFNEVIANTLARAFAFPFCSFCANYPVSSRVLLGADLRREDRMVPKRH